MTLDDARQLAEIFKDLIWSFGIIIVGILQIVNYVRMGHVQGQIEKVEKATNSLMDRQRVADHAAGVLEERERKLI